jgi:hypothetical protein
MATIAAPVSAMSVEKWVRARTAALLTIVCRTKGEKVHHLCLLKTRVSKRKALILMLMS